MRHARVIDYRRRLVTKSNEWKTRVTRLKFTNILGLGTGEVEFSSPVNVICGPNGVGKSTILKLIWAALNPEEALREPENAAKLARGSGEVQITRGASTSTHSITFPLEKRDEVDIDFPCVHVDTSADVRRIQAIFANVNDIEPFLNGASKLDLQTKEVLEVSYITRRTYSEIGLYEIELAAETLPFFVVELEGHSYDSRTMGSGEFAAFYLWWHLRRAEVGTIILLEEPESYLSPNAREAFANVLLKFASERQLYVIMTSHSGEMITPLPTSSIRFFTRGRTGVTLSQNILPPILLKTIGIETRQDILALVEDEAAKTFAKLWMEHFNPLMAKRFEFHVKGSDGEIIRTIKTTQLHYDCVTIIGLFDGDAREKIAKNLLDRSAFLPGALSAELMFKSFIIDNMSQFIDVYGWRNLPSILFAIQADDPHDWFENLAFGVGLQKNMLFLAIFNMWIKNPDNEALAKHAFIGLLAVLGLVDDDETEAKEPAAAEAIVSLDAHQGS